MSNKKYKEKVRIIIEEAEEKGLIKTYSEFLETEGADTYALSEEESTYYISQSDEELKKYKIGDIVFVSNYKYKNGGAGQNHSFVIIDDGQAIDINYFGFLISSQVEKVSYPYNEMLNKTKENRLYKDSIVKCDDLIILSEEDIKFKIGEVTDEELERFIRAYIKYLKNK